MAFPEQGEEIGVGEGQRVKEGRSSGVRAERAVRVTTVVAVAMVAAVAAFASYRHMRGVAVQHGEDAMTAAVLPFSVDGLIVAASMAMLADRRAGRRRSWLSYGLLALGACASLAANVLHAEPTFAARIIAGWPPLALLGSYELLMRQIHPTRRRTASDPITAVLPNPPQCEPTPTTTTPAPVPVPVPVPVPRADDDPNQAGSGEPPLRPGDDTGLLDSMLSSGLDGVVDLSGKREAIVRALDQTGGSATATVAVLAAQGITVSKSWVYQVRKDTPYADVHTGPLPRPAHRPTVRGRRRGMSPGRPDRRR